MLRGLSVSVEMNGDLILDTADIMTRSLVVSGVHCTATVTSVSTVSGRQCRSESVRFPHTVDHWEHSEPQLALHGHTYMHNTQCGGNSHTTYI